MMFYFDTSTCIEFLHGNLDAGLEIMRRSDPRTFKVPAVVQAELLLGAAKSHNPTRSKRAVDELLLPYEIVPFDEHCAHVYAQVRAELERDGRVIGPNDLMIAATVLAHDGIIVTNNVKEFRRVRGLYVETWAQVSLDLAPVQLS